MEVQELSYAELEQVEGGLVIVVHDPAGSYIIRTGIKSDAPFPVPEA